MIDPKELEKKQAELTKLLAETFGASSGDLQHRMRKVGRRVPKRLHAAAKVIIEAQAMAGHPKLRQFIDAAAVNRAYLDIRDHLKTIDVADRRKGAVLGLLGGLSFNLLLVLALLLAFLMWRGFL
ncbi:hypothetical protein TG4357_01017 [Thalassovita gelatinovora]|uniref:Uncharacterized protein n=1 Tax=Thalassovita gelatinovora TaxID=53501 RepID=A0A0P1FU98_THAGE|nr:hypothetical protein [Thalassovita gelatinovora]QIZ80191.1 hypothetical protein HFZ77_06745 [Thalassovita gelatinovora]CUH64014.1 hypothetical protein TG4357_01017 [Thalassovita gelatinovora]SEQ81609.1 hypothetical protein SAMN04488043_10959 [Thalassovita gelatinovora]